ncbi:glycosyltransferase family 4 protein [Lysinibacillus sphaericus]
MKILFVFYVPSGGVETLARQRSLALKDLGIQFEYLYFQRGAGIQNINEKVYITNNDQEIRQIITSNKYHAIIVDSEYPFLSRIRNLGYKGKVIYEIQGLGSFSEAENALRHAQPIVNQHADAILYPQTPHLMELVQKYYPNKKKFCFHNCIDTDSFTYKSVNMPIEKNTIIGWVGRIEENKNWKDFLLISSKLCRYSNNMRVWMFTDDNLGNPKEKARFNHMLDILGLRNKVIQYSNIPHNQMAHYYSRIGNSGGFLLSTSKVEGFGYAIVEAMSCMCPVITTDSDGVKSFVFHNKTGKLINNNIVENGKTQAIELLNNPELKANLRRNGRKFIEENFSLQHYSQNFSTALKELNLL